MPEFTLPLAARDRNWLDLRERLARAARDMHFCAVSSEAANSTALLVIAGNLAQLAMSIPMSPVQAVLGGLVEPATPFAAQIPRRDQQMCDGDQARD
jgi:hypothetical protein